MWIILVVLIVVIVLGILLIFMINKRGKARNEPSGEYKTSENNTLVKKQSIFTKIFSKKEKQKQLDTPVIKEETKEKPAETEEIEVLELYPEKKEEVKEANDDVFNLDDLFKTISMTAITDDNDFDFGLRRDNKK